MGLRKQSAQGEGGKCEAAYTLSCSNVSTPFSRRTTQTFLNDSGVFMVVVGEERKKLNHSLYG
jgi:hypothetical protein